MDSFDLPSLVKRVERLERQNRFLKQSGLVGLSLFFGLLLMAQSSRDSRAVTAERFNLVDRTGTTRAALGMTDIGPALLLVDEKGKTRVSLNSTLAGSSLRLYDAVGEGAAFEISPQSHELRLYDRSGQVRAGLMVGDEGPGLLLIDEADKLRLSVDLREGPGISLYAPTGKSGMTLGVDKNNNPQLLLYDASSILRTELLAGGIGLYDSAGTRQVTLSSGKTGPELFLLDPAGRTRAALFVSDKGPLLALSDADGKLLFSEP